MATDGIVTMTRAGGALFAGAVIAGLTLAPAVALSQEGDVNAYIARTPISGVPQTPFSTWTEAQRKATFGRIEGFCRYLCLDKYSGAAFPNEEAAMRAALEAKVCLGACIVNHLPADYPQRAALMSQVRADHDKARQLGSAVPWPLADK